jgi:hypothetical protein
MNAQRDTGLMSAAAHRDSSRTLSTVPADGFHGDGGLAAPATLLKPELRQRFGHLAQFLECVTQITLRG